MRFDVIWTLGCTVSLVSIPILTYALSPPLPSPRPLPAHLLIFDCLLVAVDNSFFPCCLGSPSHPSRPSFIIIFSDHILRPAPVFSLFVLAQLSPFFWPFRRSSTSSVFFFFHCKTPRSVNYIRIYSLVYIVPHIIIRRFTSLAESEHAFF